MRLRAVARWPERECAAGGGRGLGKVVDRELECAEMALGRADVPLHNRKLRAARRGDSRRRLEQHGDVEVILEQIAGLDRALVAAVDENDALALDIDDGRPAASARPPRRAAPPSSVRHRRASRDQPAVSRMLA